MPTTTATRQLPPRRVALPSRIKVDTFSTTVSIPFTATMIIIKNQTIAEAEETFIKRRDRETNISKQKEFDRARLLLKWAGTCGASLADMHTEPGQLKVTLSFNSMRELTEFNQYLRVNVI